MYHIKVAFRFLVGTAAASRSKYTDKASRESSMNRSQVWIAAAGVTAGLMASVVSAQESDADLAVVPARDASPPPAAERSAGPASTGGSRLIEEIIVTAQKREENLQEVPISVQAFSADALDARGIEEPKALALATPGMTYNVISGYSIIYIRGIGTDAYIPSADASIATYIDNIYYPFGHGLASALGAIERVEVLKGPQGTLFGRNATGGAINIVTKQPGPDPETQVLLSYESYEKTNVRAYTNIPLSDTLSVAVSGLRYNENSYYELTNGENLPEDTSRAFTVKTGWNPTDGFKAVLGYTYLNTQGATPMLLPVETVMPLGQALNVRVAPDYKTSEDSPVFIDSRSRVFTADLQYTAPWFDVRFIAGDQKHDSPALADFDGSGMPIAVFNTTGQFADVKTFELQFISNEDSWGSGWLTYIGGLYHIDSRAGFDPVLFSAASGLLNYIQSPSTFGIPALDTLVAGITPLSQALIAGLQGVSDAAGVPLTDLINNGVTFNLKGILGTKSTAGFFQTTANLGEAWALTLGARYQVEERTLEASQTRLSLNPNDLNQVTPVFDFARNQPSERTTNLSPKAVLDYTFGNNDMVYLSFSQGFKSGTYNIVQLYSAGEFIKPEKVTTYELGFKGTLLNGAMRLNAAAFQNDIDDLQVQSVSLLSGGAVRLETAGAARIRGADFDLIWQALPDTLPGLVLTSGAAYLDAIYTDYKQGSGYNEITGIYFDGTIFPTQDFTGNKIARTPEFSGNAGVSYTYDFENSSIEVASDVYYNAGAYFTAQNRDSSKESSYHVINARISYFYHPWSTRVTVFGKNINDARYHYNLSDFDFGSPSLLAPPSVYGMRINWEF